MKRLLTLVIFSICILPLCGKKIQLPQTEKFTSQPMEYFIYETYWVNVDSVFFMTKIFVINSEIGYIVVVKDGGSPQTSILSDILDDSSVLFVVTKDNSILDLSGLDWGFKQLPKILIQNKDKIRTEPTLEHFQKLITTPILLRPFIWYSITYVNLRDNVEISFFDLDIDNKRYKENYIEFSHVLWSINNSLIKPNSFRKKIGGVVLPASYLELQKQFRAERPENGSDK